MFSPSRLLSLLLLCLGGASLAAEPARDRFGDPLPDGAVARLGSLRLRNEHAISTAAFSADGKSLFVCDTNSISVWDMATGKTARRTAIKNLVGMRLRRFSADGKTLILSGFDNVLRFVDTSTGTERNTLNHAGSGQILALDVSRDGKLVAAVHQASIALWSIADGKLLHEFKGAPFVPLSPYGLIALTADGKQMVLPHADGSLHVVDTASGKEVRAIEMPPPRQGLPPSLRVQHLALSPDGRYLAYGGPATPLTVCELATGKRLRELKQTQGIASGLAFTPNGRFLAWSDYTGIHLFGVLSGKEIRKLDKPTRASGTLLFSPDGRTLAALRSGYTIELWNVADDAQPHPIVGHETMVQSMVFFPDGKRIVSADAYGGAIVWDIASGRDVVQRRNTAPALSLTVEADGDHLSFLNYGAVHRWNLKTNQEEVRPVTLGQAMTLSAVSPDGRSMVGMTYQPTRQLLLCNRADGKTARLLGPPEQAFVSQVVFSPDSRRLAASANDGTLWLWDRDTAALVREVKPATPGRQPIQLSFAADGRSLALFDGAVRIREIAGGGERLQIPVPGGLFSLAYSADARFLALGQSDGKVSVHNTVSGKQLVQWQGKQGFVRALAFSRDGRLLASGGENGTILVWTVPEGEDLPATLKAEEAVAFWQALAAEEASRANRALASLTAAPAQAVPLIKERFRAAGPPPSAERLARLIAELDDDAFKVRERAMRELAEAGPDAADALRTALANDPSVEKKGRLEKLLARLGKGGDPERLRCLRAIEVLERIGTPQAKEALRELADKDIGAALRDEIRASLRRMEQRR